MTSVMPVQRDYARALCLFTTTAILVFWLAGHRLVLVNDEGIYLDGAVRLLHGSLPYRDFFALTGPGTFWNLALIFKLFGVSLASARVLLAIDIGLICACMYWLAAKLYSRPLGLWICGFQLALLAADRGSLVVNHRWDSAACGLLAASCFVHALRSGRSWPMVAAGAVSAYGAWITPPLGLVALVMLGWVVHQKQRRAAAAFVTGIAGTSLLAITALVATGSLRPLITAIVWTGSQYSAANHFGYGGVIGGYLQLFTGARGADLLLRLFLVCFVALPAIVPVCGAIVYTAKAPLRHGPGWFVALCAAAAIAGCYPRMDAGHLIYAAPLCYVATACAIASIAPARLCLALLLLGSVGASLFGLSAILNRCALQHETRRAGTLMSEPGDLALVRDIEASVRPGEPFLAFPYLPIAYFLTGGRNPTRYSFLQPGMMSDADERIALDGLTRSPPGTVLYMAVTPEAYLRLFPSSDPARLRMHRIETLLARCYQGDAVFARAHPGYELLRWQGPNGDRGVCAAPQGYN